MDKSKVWQVRYWATVHGYDLRKSKARRVTKEDRGEFMLLSKATGVCVIGQNFSASVDEIGDWLIENGGRL